MKKIFLLGFTFILMSGCALLKRDISINGDVVSAKKSVYKNYTATKDADNFIMTLHRRPATPAPVPSSATPADK